MSEGGPHLKIGARSWRHGPHRVGSNLRRMRTVLVQAYECTEADLVGATYEQSPFQAIYEAVSRDFVPKGAGGHAFISASRGQ